MICAVHKILCLVIKKDEMGWTCGMCGAEKE